MSNSYTGIPTLCLGNSYTGIPTLCHGQQLYAYTCVVSCATVIRGKPAWYHGQQLYGYTYVVSRQQLYGYTYVVSLATVIRVYLRLILLVKCNTLILYSYFHRTSIFLLLVSVTFYRCIEKKA